MIITCEKCTKKFNIEDNLIPDDGRLLQCGSCNHKWFYKKIKQSLRIELEDNKNNDDRKTLINKPTKKEKIIKNNVSGDYKNIKKPKKKLNLLKNFIVIFISLMALIILLDTFKYQLEKYIPDLKFILNNLYETLKDLFLFTKDLLIK
tara:strand:+ start:99 stop:542 length:444 start_codon:yes stop_codon:yes gene_type:complete